MVRFDDALPVVSVPADPVKETEPLLLVADAVVDTAVPPEGDMSMNPELVLLEEDDSVLDADPDAEVAVLSDEVDELPDPVSLPLEDVSSPVDEGAGLDMRVVVAVDANDELSAPTLEEVVSAVALPSVPTVATTVTPSVCCEDAAVPCCRR